MHRTDNRQRATPFTCMCLAIATHAPVDSTHEGCEYVHNNNKHILYKFKFMYYRIKEVHARMCALRLVVYFFLFLLFSKNSLHENESALFHFRQTKCFRYKKIHTTTRKVQRKKKLEKNTSQHLMFLHGKQ